LLEIEFRPQTFRAGGAGGGGHLWVWPWRVA
jgi:hypothetical protein